MIFRLVFFLLAVLGFVQIGSAQQHINYEALDSIHVEVDQNAQAFYIHTLLQGETPYSLSRYFKINYRDLLITNGLGEEDIIPVGARIKIPINLDFLNTTPRTQPQHSEVPVVYEVRKMETLFKISQVYFKQKIEHLVARNEIRKLSLRTGEKLIVGYWHGPEASPSSDPLKITQSDSMSDIAQTTINDTSSSVKTEIPDSSIVAVTRKDSIVQVQAPKIINTRGIALWERSDSNTETLLVLHKTARPGSVIKLLNPVTDRIVVAQVVGPIPQNVYTSDIDAIVSRAVAQKLGALDTRFQVSMTFYE